MAEFEATAPFSIHLERPKGGFINMLQRSVDSGTFVAVKNFNPNYNATQVIDADCGQGAVYPKWIRLESAVEPSVAEVTFESESSGGGAGTADSGGVEYIDISGTYGAGELGTLASLVKVKNDDGTYIIAPPIMALTTSNSLDATKMLNTVALAVNPNDRIITPYYTTINESVGGVYSQFPRITKEQFYSLEA